MRLLASIAIALVGFVPTAFADDYVAEWAPPIGSVMPAISAQDHTGQARTSEDLAGENGMLIFLNRSADW